MSTHLTPEQVSDLLLGILATGTAAHLSECPQCRTEVQAAHQTLSQTMTSFRSAAVSWSEETAKQITSPKTQRAIRPWNRPWARPAWALAAALIVAITIPVSVWRARINKLNADANTQAQISRDNQLLEQIESEVSETTPAPMQPLQVNSK